MVVISRWFLVFALAATGCGQHSRQSVSLYQAGDYAAAARAADEGLAEHPSDDGLWQMRVRSALALGDSDGVAKAYAKYRDQRDGEDDHGLLRDLAIATLAQGLASPSARLKVIAIEAVESSEIHPLTDQVIERLGDEDDRVVATAAVAVLRGYQEAPHAARRMLASDDPEARRIAVDGIARKVGKLALADIEKAAEDGDPRVRSVAIRWLGQLRDREAEDLLERQLRHSDEGVRAQAARALARIGIGDLAGYARRALADRALGVRLAGIELAVVARMTDDLMKLAEDPDPTVASEAAITTKQPALIARAIDRAAAHEAWNIRAGAVLLAGRGLDKAGAAALARKLAGDREPRVRIAAARALTADRALAIATLTQAMTGANELQAATALAELGDPKGLATLDRLVRDRAATSDGRASAAAAHRSARKITPGLVAALADGNGIVRLEAAAALANLTRRK